MTCPVYRHRRSVRLPAESGVQLTLAVIVSLTILCAMIGSVAATEPGNMPPDELHLTDQQHAEPSEPVDVPIPVETNRLLAAACGDCHNDETAEGGLNLLRLPWHLADTSNRDRWIRIHDRVESCEMPPEPNSLTDKQRGRLLLQLSEPLHAADAEEIRRSGRGPFRRLTRDEYQQTLCDILALPQLDIQDMLPEDRVSHHFRRTASTLDVSRVQLTAWLDAAEAALHQAIASGVGPPPRTQFRAVGRQLFSSTSTFGEREAMFFARDGKAIDNKSLTESPVDSPLELALFRSAHWPYYGYPSGFVATRPGEYRVKFSARAVLQLPGYELKLATQPVPMTFRARKPSGPDVSGDVRATGGLMDIQPEAAVYETSVSLKPGETFEYSLLGLPVPLARNVDGGPPTYRYPPFPPGGQPGVAFQWLEIDGPLAFGDWPPASHRILFDDLPLTAVPSSSTLPVQVVSTDPHSDIRRLVHRFLYQAAREPLSDATIESFQSLALARLAAGESFTEALLTAYKAFLCSGHVLYQQTPHTTSSDGAASNVTLQYALASRLSYFLTSSRPDAELLEHASVGRLTQPDTLREQTDRLLNGPAFDRFTTQFTDDWLNLRYIHRDVPDNRLYPEYRFDAYLIESMERETRSSFAWLVHENRPVTELIDADYVLINDRLAGHYHLPAINGSAIRQVLLPPDSPYGGLLTQAAIMKLTANGTTTSPVVRGAWIMDRLIGDPPPPPPASVPAVEPDVRGATTIRELLVRHTSSRECAACHARFDPVGLALENFDILGAWRTRYRSLETGDMQTGIDRAGHDYAYALSSPVDSRGSLRDGRTFQNIHELKKLLMSDPRQLARNLLKQFTIYATGTPVRFSDRADIEQILDRCQPAGYRVRDLLHGLIQSRIFCGTYVAAD